MGVSRAMFWRIIRRLITANRGRLFVILLALAAGAAITAALLNLQVDANRRLTTEFRAFGANVIIAPLNAENRRDLPANLETTEFARIPSENQGATVTKGAFLYAVAEATAYREGREPNSAHIVLLTGYRWSGEDFNALVPYKQTEGQNVVFLDIDTCEVGERIAAAFHLRPGDHLEVSLEGKTRLFGVAEVRSFGGPEDDQVFVPLEDLQELAGLSGWISLIQISVPGTPQSIDRYVSEVRKQMPTASVQPVRQFTEAQEKIYHRINNLLTAAIVLVLILTTLCVLAAMTNVAMERRNDVGLMKAIGGATRRVARLFLTEAALLGLVGGSLGAGLGILLSMELGKAVFGVAARPRLIVYPIAVGLTVLVAIVSAYPLRRLAGVRPAVVFRGEA
jgi:putative ABC transport system permease protein